MSSTVTVSTADLGRTLDYLGGLLVILQRLSHDHVGRDQRDPMLQELQDGVEFSTDTWEPLTYEFGVGSGWTYVAENAANLRDRLLQAYENDSQSRN